MVDEATARILDNPKYRALRARRTRFGWFLTVCMLVAYYGYIALIAFDKQALARPIGDGVTSLGIPVGIGLIVFTVLITAVYVRRANTEFDRLTRELVEDIRP
jgi:uncharacterized membrane protein (DUF485 family)